MLNRTGIVGFDWDQGNALKSTQKQRVSCCEAEELFQNAPLLVLPTPGTARTKNATTPSDAPMRDGCSTLLDLTQ